MNSKMQSPKLNSVSKNSHLNEVNKICSKLKPKKTINVINCIAFYELFLSKIIIKMKIEEQTVQNLSLLN